MHEGDLIYDWNTAAGETPPARPAPEMNDETLRDGLQNPSVLDPSIGQKLRILHYMAELGIESADIGLPGAGPRATEHVERLAREIVDADLPMVANCAARTVVADVRPIAEVSQRVGIPLEASTFIGSSPIRQYAEDWTLDAMLRTSEEAVRFAVDEGLPVMFVTEDTTRARPEALKELYGRAIEWGARRLCLADTVGHATPEGTRNLIRFVREEIVEPSGEDVLVDWHGHRDRGLGLANALAAMEAGADRIHGTALGIGERVGNVEMELLLVNLHLMGVKERSLDALPDYCRTVAEACGVPLPPGYPVVGKDAFRTATGVHASAIIKAEEKGDAWLADRIYSGIPASLVGRSQEIEVGPMSGLSNVRYWLRTHGYDASNEDLCHRIMEAAKRSSRTLPKEELNALAQEA